MALVPKRPWLGVVFSCCGSYGRLYQSANRKNWQGHCTVCARKFNYPNTRDAQGKDKPNI